MRSEKISAGSHPEVHSPVLVLLSGGLDSTACVHFYATRQYPTRALFVDFGQKSVIRERAAAVKIAAYFSVEVDQVRLACGRQFGPGEILGRNAFMLFAALLLTPSRSGTIAMGIHAGSRYYDCSERFVGDMQRLLDGYAGGMIRFGAPFLEWTKAQILCYHAQNELPTDLTYSCELGLEQPCGICPSCKDVEMYHARKNVEDRP